MSEESREEFNRRRLKEISALLASPPSPEMQMVGGLLVSLINITQLLIEKNALSKKDVLNRLRDGSDDVATIPLSELGREMVDLLSDEIAKGRS